jgi:hypothetical protein
MYNFKDIEALQTVVELAFSVGEGETGRLWLEDELIREFRLSPRQAKNYTSVITSVNNKDSKDIILNNFNNLIGSWKKFNSNSSGNYFSSSTKTIMFNSDLTFNIINETNESYSSPFGSYFNNPKITERYGMWAPCDNSDRIKVVMVEKNEPGNVVNIEFPAFNTIKIFNGSYIRS